MVLNDSEHLGTGQARTIADKKDAKSRERRNGIHTRAKNTLNIQERRFMESSSWSCIEMIFC